MQDASGIRLTVIDDGKGFDAQCSGIWCDYGEWDILTQLGLHSTIERLFSSEWQIQVREKQQAQKERQALIEKMGMELAEHLFDLAEVLQNHPNGDFGVAYLMRNVSESVQQNNKK
ncbi:MAG: hypothetical protein F6K10_31580 [Moorea sp. SIO2B7]|nr:hypothetical protein [Moorena sp. SIO2B7]